MADPQPRSLVEAIEPAGIRIRSYSWFPTRGVDRMKLVSDSQPAAKVALQKADEDRAIMASSCLADAEAPGRRPT